MSEKPISDLRRRMIAGHDGPQLRREDAARLYPAHRDLCQISRPLARHGDRRRHPPLPARTDRAGRAAAEDEHAGLGVALLLHHHAAAAPTSPISWPARTIRASCRGCSRRRRSRRLLEAAPGPGLKYKAALEHRLRRRPARRRGRHAAGRRHRFQAHADPRRDGQGPQGSARHAVAAAARAAARVVAAVPLAEAGCSRATIRCCRSRCASSTASATWRPRRRGSAAGSRRTRCGTPSPRTCWRATSTCA